MRRWTLARWRTIGATVAVLAFGFTLYALGTNIDRNRQAIRVSCTLLVNAVIESGANRGNNEATVLFVRAIKRVMTPEERRQLDAALRNGPQGGVSIPPCDRVAQHPDTVRASKIGPAGATGATGARGRTGATGPTGP